MNTRTFTLKTILERSRSSQKKCYEQNKKNTRTGTNRNYEIIFIHGIMTCSDILENMIRTWYLSKVQLTKAMGE